MSQLNITSLTYTTLSGQSVTASLRAPLICSDTVSSSMLCHLVLPRLPLSPAAALLLGLLLDERLAGIPVRHSYTELGALLGRGQHTAMRTVAELRQRGLLATTRFGCRDARLSFLCGPLLSWADSVLGQTIAPDARERPSAPVVASTSTAMPPAACAVPEAASRASGRIPLPDGALRAEEPRTAAGRAIRQKALAFVDTIVDDRPDWPAVPGNWRGLVNIPLPCDDDAVAPYVPLGVKPWLCGIPRLPNGDYDLDKLVRMPYQIVLATDEAAFHALCQATGDRQDGPIEIVADEPVVDASAEREAELRLAGPQRDDSSEEEFAFDSGADTAETDIGHGVQANPDL